ncbi:putative membrane protein [Campylobacter ureolyticus]|uniref:Membrane protein n=1 Tax=Campylobacter ureolyticus TaxID=827 RepID=A0AAE7E9P7_9BACT|nr:putative membrane protein [Campylobacter ureolyticus]
MQKRSNLSDDKREKLREYLRNNRPRNNINLGNNSNNKEKKNLENELNLDNSQISNNKTNLDKRNYDKDPLIIKNYNSANLLSYILISLIIYSIFIKFLYNFGLIDLSYYGRTYLTYHENLTFIVYIFLEFLAAIYFYHIKEKDIIINNSYITYFGNNNSKGLDIEILNEKNFINEKYNLKINFIFFIFLVIAFIGGINFSNFIFAFGIFFVRYMPIILFSFHKNKNFTFFNPGYLCIKTKYYKKIIPLVFKDNTSKVKKYFLEKLDIDITNKINRFI